MPKASGKRVTLKDVAAQVGVTPAAVSMALLDNGRISSGTRTRIKDAARELGYVGSSSARALRNQKTNTIALIVPLTATHVFGHAYFTHVLQGVVEAANRRNVQVLLATDPDEDDGLAAYERVLQSHMVDGAIVTSAAIDDPTVQRLAQGGVPVVLIGNFPYLEDAVTVGIDDRSASALVTEHLLTVHRRTRLLHVSGPLDHQTGLDRKLGFLDAVSEAGIADQAVIWEGDLSEAGGARAVQELSSVIDEFDGIVLANDDMAYGAMTELAAHGLDVPGRVSVVGFDDFGLARVVTPGITTVRVPVEQMARSACDRLLDVIDGKAGWTRQDHDVSLVTRRSCGCPAVA